MSDSEEKEGIQETAKYELQVPTEECKELVFRTDVYLEDVIVWDHLDLPHDSERKRFYASLAATLTKQPLATIMDLGRTDFEEVYKIAAMILDHWAVIDRDYEYGEGDTVSVALSRKPKKDMGDYVFPSKVTTRPLTGRDMCLADSERGGLYGKRCALYEHVLGIPASKSRYMHMGDFYGIFFAFEETEKKILERSLEKKASPECEQASSAQESQL